MNKSDCRARPTALPIPTDDNSPARIRPGMPKVKPLSQDHLFEKSRSVLKKSKDLRV